MCELYEVAACPHASVLRNKGVYASVYELAQKLYYRGMYAGASLHECAYSREHCGTNLDIGEWVAGACGVAAYNVVLKFFEVAVVDTPLCHGAEAGVDAVYYFVGDKAFEEVIAFGDLLHFTFRKCKFCVSEQDIIY